MTDATQLVQWEPGGGALTIYDPRDGQAHELADAPPDVLLLVVGALREGADAIRYEFGRRWNEVEEEILRRMDADASWTMRAGRVEAKAPSPSAGTTGWDKPKLIGILTELAAEGEISQAAFEAAVESKVVRSVRMQGVNALLKLPAVRERIEAAAISTDPPPRRVTVTVAPETPRR